MTPAETAIKNINDTSEFCTITYSTCAEHGPSYYPVVRLTPLKMDLEGLGWPWGMQITGPLETNEIAVEYVKEVERFMKAFVEAYK